MSRKWFKTLLFGLLIGISVGARVAYIIKQESYHSHRPAEMERAAENIAREGTIARIFSDDSGYSAHVCPLYPYFLGGIYRVFGWNTASGKLVQELCAIAITTLGFVLLPILAKRTGLSAEAGWLAAFILAVMPLSLWIETSGSWEQPYAAFALMVLMLCFQKLADTEWTSPRLIVLTGLLCGIIGLLTPIALPAGALIILSQFISGKSYRSRIVVGTCLIGLVAAATLAPWTIRNYRVFGVIVPFRSNFGLELFLGNNPLSNSMPLNDPPNEAIRNLHPFNNSDELEKLKSVGEIAYMTGKKNEAVSWMSSHPAQVLQLTMYRFRNFWFPGRDIWPPDSSMRGLKSFVYTAFSVLAFLQLGWMSIKNGRQASLYAAVLFGPTISYMITHIDMRYRYPTIAICALLSCQFIVSVVRLSYTRLKS